MINIEDKKKIEYNFFIGKIELIPMNLQRSLFIIEIQKKKYSKDIYKI